MRRFGWPGLRDVGQHLSARDAGLLTHAVAVLTWHRSHTHCPRCGSPTEPSMAGAVRVCTNDGSEHFPAGRSGHDRAGRSPDGEPGRAGPRRPMAASVLLLPRRLRRAGRIGGAGGRFARWPKRSGSSVRDVRYQASQPWPFPSSLMLGFTAVADVGALHPQPAELAAAAWFTRDEVTSGLATRSWAAAGGVDRPRADRRLARALTGSGVRRDRRAARPSRRAPTGRCSPPGRARADRGCAPTCAAGRRLRAAQRGPRTRRRPRRGGRRGRRGRPACRQVWPEIVHADVTRAPLRDAGVREQHGGEMDEGPPVV